MIKPTRLKHLPRILLMAVTSIAGACQSVAAKQIPQAARLVKADDASIYNVKSAIEAAMSRKNIVFGATNWDNSSTISVLPVRSVSPHGAPFNQADFQRPVLFDLMMDQDGCYLRQQGREDKIKLEGVDCVALKPIK